ncbi:BCCT family transporter [Emergencia sp.]|uniref:BCCT family transporter n=1 Tax=Emergencia sp. TaxID=1926557 RepID=UPI003AEF216E
MKETKEKTSAFKLNNAIFWPIVVIMVAIIALSFINQDGFSTFVSGALNAEVINFKWFVGPITLFMFITMVAMIFHPIGKVKLGGADAKPKFKTFSYWGMCICSTIAIGIVFYGVVQPLTYFMEPWESWGVEAGSAAAAVKALAQNNLEWAWGQYAQYGIFAMALGVAIYNYNQPSRVSSFLYCINGRPANSKLNTVIDVVCLFGIVSGVTCSLGTGTMQISAGLKSIFGIEVSNVTWLIVEVVIVLGFLLMSIGGIAKGIKIITDQNLRLYIIVLIFVAIVGPTLYIFDMFTESTSSTFGCFIESICYTGGIDGNDGPIFWMIWQYVSVAAFAPIVGLFLAKISYGRSLKEIAIGTMVIPALFTCAWFVIFGSLAFDMQTSGRFDIWGAMSELGMEATMFELFKQLPGGILWCVVFLVVIYLSFVTLASSSTTTAAMVSTVQLRAVSDDEEPPLWMKSTWALVMAVSAYVFISFAGITGAKSMALIGGMPSMLLGAACACCVWRIGRLKENYSEAAVLEEKEEK